MSFLTPLAFWGALLAIPIILLYMLRLRRREMPISSTYLWQQLFQDQEANTPWQRLRRNLLLLLQLLILALLVLTLARPYITVPAIATGQTALLLDASASMNAADMDGQTRFEAAKQRALDIIAAKAPSDALTVIRVGAVPDVLATYTDNYAALRDAVNGAQPGNGRADWVGALTLAAAGGQNASDFKVVIISDGGLGAAQGLPAIPGEIRYVPIGQSSSNIAITALATSTLAGKDPQLFAQIHNYGPVDAEVIFSLRVDGELFASKRDTVPANGDLPILSQALPAQFTRLQASITLPAASTLVDYLPQDNEAFAVSSGVTSRRVLLMTRGNLFVEQVLRSLPTLEAFKGDITRPLPTQPFDVYIFDGWLPNRLPEGDLFIINPPNSTALFTVGETSETPRGILVQRGDPLTEFVDFGSVNILKFKQLSNVDWARAPIRTDDGALLLAGETGGRKVVILTFDVRDSDLPLQIAWPVLMANLMEWFAPRSAIAAQNSLKVGEALVVRPPFEADTVRVTLPDGGQHLLVVDRETILFSRTDTPGIYQLDLLKAGEVLQSQAFAVNLFDAQESDITPRESITIAGSTIVETQREELSQREFWPEIVLLALLVLVVEWVVYHRRMRVPTVMTPVFQRRRIG